MKKHYIIEIPTYKEGELYKKSVENLRIRQYQEKDNITTEMNLRKKFIGSPLPRKEKIGYFQELGRAYQKSKVKLLF